MSQRYRCVVTGQDAGGKSRVVRDTTVATEALGIADFTCPAPGSPTRGWPTLTN